MTVGAVLVIAGAIQGLVGAILRSKPLFTLGGAVFAAGAVFLLAALYA